MAERKSMSFLVVVVSLVIAGGVLYYAVAQLSTDITPRESGAGPGSDLFEVVRTGNATDLATRVKGGSRVDAVMENGETWQRGMTPLMLAASAGRTECVKVLLDAGAKVEARSPDDRTALFWAAGWGNPETVRMLLEKQANVNVRSQDNWTPLVIAAARGEAASVDAIIKGGADVNAVNRWGQSALMSAVRSGDPAKTKLLLDAGANVNVADMEGLTAMHLAAEATEAAALIDLLKSKGADPNAKDDAGMTPLMKAGDQANTGAIQALLALGAKKDDKDAEGRTAADWATARDDEAGRKAAELLK